MSFATGLDKLQSEGFGPLLGKSIGVLCNQSSVNASYEHILDLLLPFHQKNLLSVRAVFGPEHGLHGHTQDNMIEWEGVMDPRTGFTIHSLYGQHREPTTAMLDAVELLVVDIPDVGARYYTFIWTMALCMRQCEQLGIPVLVLDRPNPIGGLQQEGTLLRQEFDSFVGLYPLPTRHSLTVAEVAVYLRSHYFPKLDLEFQLMPTWDRSTYADELPYAWTMPSPNMPTVDTAVVYPGGCLVEGTNLSEGRGTTRPFEIIGAPFIDAWQFCDDLNRLNLAGTYFRPVQFEPTFNKWAKVLCGGAFIHVTDRRTFNSTLTTVAMLQAATRRYTTNFAWKPGPYEYETEKRPIDILCGNNWLATAIENLTPLPEIQDRFQSEVEEFEDSRKSSLMY